MDNGEVFITGIVEQKIVGFAYKNGFSYEFEISVADEGNTQISLDEIREHILGNLPPSVGFDPNNRLVKNENVRMDPKLKKIFDDIEEIEAKYRGKTQKLEKNEINMEDMEDWTPVDFTMRPFYNERHGDLLDLSDEDPLLALKEVIDILAELGALGDEA